MRPIPLLKLILLSFAIFSCASLAQPTSAYDSCDLNDGCYAIGSHTACQGNQTCTYADEECRDYSTVCTRTENQCTADPANYWNGAEWLYTPDLASWTWTELCMTYSSTECATYGDAQCLGWSPYCSVYGDPVCTNWTQECDPPYCSNYESYCAHYTPAQVIVGYAPELYGLNCNELEALLNPERCFAIRWVPVYETQMVCDDWQQQCTSYAQNCTDICTAVDEPCTTWSTYCSGGWTVPCVEYACLEYYGYYAHYIQICNKFEDVCVATDCTHSVTGSRSYQTSCSQVDGQCGYVTAYALSVSKSGTGSGTVTSNPSGINCGTDCSENYTPGTSVTLTASPAAGSTFAGWSGACSGIGICTLSMSANQSVTATFDVIINQPPDKPTKSQETTWDHCVFLGKSIPTLYWTYSDPDDVPPGTDPQTAYIIEVDENASFNPPVFHFVSNTGSTSYALNVDWLDWNATYFWRVSVKDSHNNWSATSSAQQFKTPQEAYPYSGFTWEPQEPNQKEVVIFTPDDAGLPSYLWTVTEGTAVFTDSTGPTSEQPHIIFESIDNKIKLQVTKDSYTCESAEYEITANLPLPEYHEVPPIVWLKKSLSSLATLLDGLYFLKKF